MNPTGSGHLNVECEKTDHGIILQPQGDVDLSRSPDLRARIAEVQRPNPSAKLILDLTHVPYMDSSGVATLVEAMQVARKNGGQIVLCNLNDRVRSIIEIARLDMVFTIVPTLEDAKNV